MRRYYLIVLTILPMLARSQVGDCEHAVSLDSNTKYIAAAVSGPGSVTEITGNELGSKYFFTEEHNTIWYSFTAPYDASLTFGIVPDVPEDDWDFLLFERKDEGACKLIATKQLLPLRSNLARNEVANKSVTGLADTAKKEFEVAGPNSNFSKALDVKKDNSFLLVVDNNKQANNGHVLTLSYRKKIPETPAKTTDTTSPVTPLKKMVEWVNEKPVEPKTKYKFNVFDNNLKQPLTCTLKVVFESNGFGEDSSVVFENRNEISIVAESSRNFSVSVSKDGYMFMSKNYRSFRVDTALSESFYLPKADQGEMISLPDINFKENTLHLLTNSIYALEQIYDFMVKNPKAVIEIRGHVNAPGYDNEGKVKKFSEKRAEEVKNFLVGMGIDGKRMKTTGMGNEFMIYPNPADYQQEKMNRRVDILILEN